MISCSEQNKPPGGNRYLEMSRAPGRPSKIKSLNKDVIRRWASESAIKSLLGLPKLNQQKPNTTWLYFYDFNPTRTLLYWQNLSFPHFCCLFHSLSPLTVFLYVQLYICFFSRRVFVQAWEHCSMAEGTCFGVPSLRKQISRGGLETLSTFANTHWMEAVCENNGEGLPDSIADETHLSVLVNDIWIWADLHGQKKQTAAVSSMLFTTTSSQPCYCKKDKHKTIASLLQPPTLLKSSRSQSQCSAVLLQSLEVKDPSCCITRVMGWTLLAQTRWPFADWKLRSRIKSNNGAPGWD